MTTLIFGAPVLVHKGIVHHRREKARKHNYERWESLRDDYDEEKRTARLSAEYERERRHSASPASFASWSSSSPQEEDQQQQQMQHQEDLDRERYEHSDRKVLITRRDQQEANDARTAWRPQEAWGEREERIHPSRLAGREGASQQHLLPPPPPLPPKQRFGPAAWDEGLPEPLKVERRWYDQERDDTAMRARSAEPVARRRPETDVLVVESPYDWWEK